jgi:type II secretory pathway component PulM
MKEKLVAFWKQRTGRERIILAAATLFAACIMIYPMLFAPIQEAFSEQSRQLTELRNTYETTPDILARYANLVSRRKDIDAFYSRADLSSDPLTHLETLLRDTAKAAGTYNVGTQKEGIPLGNKYIHKFFTVNFQTSSYEDLSAFLKALTSGPQPMLVSQINLDKRSGSETLNVQLEVSGFEAVSK